MAGITGRPWRRVQAQVFATETHCCLCGAWVDPTLPVNDQYARSVHHVISPQDAPHLALERANLRLAHRGCNWRAGQGADPIAVTPTRLWR